jgi:KipI family sensor histidine kinase inhibitor
MPTKPPAATQEATLQVEALGDRALLVVLGKGIDPDVNGQVHKLAALLRKRGLPGVHDLVPAYATVAVHYDPAAWSGGKVPPNERLGREIIRLWKSAGTAALPAPRQVEIPVCYGGEFGPDLAEVARLCALSEEEVIARHGAASYRVYMIGFSPGFAYLGGLDAAIAAPRRATPRTLVPAGSVGIAGLQTGIYPLATPGGWQIIGQTPKRLFLPEREAPCLLSPGDTLRFVPIGAEAFRASAGDAS